jgi:MFS family permease
LLIFVEYSEHQSAQLTSLIYFIGAFLSPIVGWYVDMWGFRMQLMSFGIALMIPAFVSLAYTMWDPIAPVVLLGLSYAIVPSVMWTIIPLIGRLYSMKSKVLVPEYLAGKAFGISYSLYDGTLFAIPLIYGQLHEVTSDGYMWGITLYLGLTVIALIACVPLWLLDNSKGELVLQKPAPGTLYNFNSYF